KGAGTRGSRPHPRQDRAADPLTHVHPATRTAIYRRLRAANPAPTTELEHGSSFELLVAVMLSAHTTDKSVNAATRNLFPVANTPPQFRKDAHHWLLLHGRYVCTARSPACPTCILRDLCEYPRKTPVRAPRPASRRLRRALLAGHDLNRKRRQRTSA